MATVSQDPSVAAPHRYRSISVWTVLSLVFGAATPLMIVFAWIAAVLPAAAVLCGWVALRQLDRMPDEYAGERMAKAGIGLGVGLGILIGGWLFFFASEVPPGYQEIKDYSILEPAKGEIVPASALELSDKKTKVFVRGYILPGRMRTGMNEFLICRTSDQCRFAQPNFRPTDLIHVKLTGDLTADYTTYQIGVGGVFKVDLGLPDGTPYIIEADTIHR